MSDTVIRVRDLGKRYRIGTQQRRHDSLREQLVDGLASSARLITSLGPGFARSSPSVEATADDEFWALRDVSFDVRQGEVVGIIGRNGAGKSTLLKVLCQITKPTVGRGEIVGRVGSLLEVGTGFHPELTGRENIYLNGAILGMRRREIASRFDEIVAFAEIERFLDTPVKRYSSGMYVRLAFAVAAHLEPEVLLVDEVLAVGDAAFQRKCLGKMSEVSREGRTILFVSHNMGAVQTLCRRGILIRGGEVAIDGSVEDAVSAYLRTMEQAASYDLAARSERTGKGQVRLVDVEISDGERPNCSTLVTGRPARFAFRAAPFRSGTSCIFCIYDSFGNRIVCFTSAHRTSEDIVDHGLQDRLMCELDELLLLPGRYRINVELFLGGESQDRVEGAAFIDVEPGYLRGRPVFPSGDVCMHHHWVSPL